MVHTQLITNAQILQILRISELGFTFSVGIIYCITIMLSDVDFLCPDFTFLFLWGCLSTLYSTIHTGSEAAGSHATSWVMCITTSCKKYLLEHLRVTKTRSQRDASKRHAIGCPTAKILRPRYRHRTGNPTAPESFRAKRHSLTPQEADFPAGPISRARSPC